MRTTGKKVKEKRWEEVVTYISNDSFEGGGLIYMIQPFKYGY
jgi:hypothetical protein